MEICKLVLGVDPGATTGLCLVRLEGGSPPAAVWRDQAPWHDAAERVRRFLTTAEPHPCDKVVAVERFMVNAKTAQRGQQYIEDAIGMIGVCRLYAHGYAAPLVMESSSAAKKVVDDDALRALDLYASGRKHANDAARQAALYGVKRGLVHLSLIL